MNLLLEPGQLAGTVSAIPSKSAAHRLLILAALADGETRLRLPSSSADIEATLRCLSALGASFVREGDRLTVTPISSAPASPTLDSPSLDRPSLDCGESGSTLRFLLPVAAALTDGASFTGSGRLPERPIGELAQAMSAHGVRFSGAHLPLTLSGRLLSGVYPLPGNVSSQYITGLLLALPLLPGDSDIRLTGPLESAAYVEMTLLALAAFGCTVTPVPDGWHIPGGQRYHTPGTLSVEGDWSNAAFFLCGGALSGRVSVSGLDAHSPQGDKAVMNLLRGFGADVSMEDDTVTVTLPETLHASVIDVSGVPDLLPILAVVAANAPGETRFTGGARLRMKESDRLSATAAMLTTLGGSVTELPDGLLVRGGRLTGGSRTGGTVDSFHDHRIAMAAAIAALTCERPVTLLGGEAVDKSYPGFFADYAHLGGKAHVL